jgi:hypothetical protein
VSRLIASVDHAGQHRVVSMDTDCFSRPDSGEGLALPRRHPLALTPANGGTTPVKQSRRMGHYWGRRTRSG